MFLAIRGNGVNITPKMLRCSLRANLNGTHTRRKCRHVEGGGEQSWPGLNLWLVIFLLNESVYTACLSCHCVFIAFLHRLQLYFSLQVAHLHAMYPDSIHTLCRVEAIDLQLAPNLRQETQDGNTE